MDPQQLIVALSYTFSPDPAQRHQAETAIKTLPTVDGGAAALLQIVGAGEQVAKEVRQAAAIAFKNIAKNYWEPLGSGLGLGAGCVTREQCVPEASKPPLRDMLFQVLLAEADKVVRDQLAESVNQLARTDYPARWPQLLPEVLSTVQSGDPLRMHNALLALRQVVKRLEYKQKGPARAPLEQIVREALPLLQLLMQQLLETQNQTLEAALIMKLCLKILWSCTQFDLPEGCGGGEAAAAAAAAAGSGAHGEGGAQVSTCDPSVLTHLGKWLELMAVVLSKPLPEASEGLEPAGQPLGEEERNAWPWWKLKKWALQLLSRWFHRYGMPQYASEEYSSFAAAFSSEYAPRLLEPVMHTLSLRLQGRFCSKRCTHLCLVFLESAVQLGTTYAILKPHMPQLLTGIVFPQLCLSDADVDMFESDPLEYVRRQHDPMEDFTSPKMSAMTLLESIVKYRKKDNLDLFLGFCVESLNEYAQATTPETKDARKKEGVLMSLAVLADVLKKQKKYSSQLEPLLVAHVLPEYTSPVAFLRARAASLTTSFYDVKFSNFENVAELLRLNLAALRDPSLPVQVEAANGMSKLIDLEGTEALLLPVLPELLNEYFRIMSEIGSDTVVAALESIINKFGDHIIPHAAVLIQKLCESFMQYAIDGGGGDDDEAAMAACQCVEAVATVLHTIVEADANTTLFPQVQPFLLPVVRTILSPSGDFLEYLENGLEILTFVTYHVSAAESTDPAASNSGASTSSLASEAASAAVAPYFELFPLLVNAFHQFAYDYVCNMVSPIDNMIGFAPDLFLSSRSSPSPAPVGNLLTTGAAAAQGESKSFVELTLGMVEKVFVNRSRQNEKETQSAGHLLLSLLHNCAGRLDDALPRILHLVLARLNPQPVPTELLVRVPEGVLEGQPIPIDLKSEGGVLSVPCPRGALPGTDTLVTVTVPPEPLSSSVTSSLLSVVASAFYYNTPLTLNWLEASSVGGGGASAFFNAWFAEMDKSGGSWKHLPSKLTVLALSSVLAQPLEALPPCCQESMPAILGKLVYFLKEIDEANTGGDDDDDDDDDDAAEDEDDDEDDDEEEEEDFDDNDGGEANENATDEEHVKYMKGLKAESSKIMKLALAEAGEFGDDEDGDLYDEDDAYSSPIDQVDELTVFYAALMQASAAAPQFFGPVQAALPPEAQQQCASLLTKAHARQHAASVGGGGL